MSTLVAQIRAIEEQVKVLTEQNKKLKQIIIDREKAIAALEEKTDSVQMALEDAEDRIITLRTANAMLGSDDYKTKTKLKINALVREIDQCIAQLT